MNEKDWICHICGNENPFHKATCSHCGPGPGRSKRGIAGWHATTCQACGQTSLRDLINIVDARGPTAMWNLRSVAINHVSAPFAPHLKKIKGLWVCYRCCSPDIVITPYDGHERRCPCGARLRPSNPGPLCEACKLKERPHRNCAGCGRRLSREDHQYCEICQPQRRCGCGAILDGNDSVCLECRDKGLPGHTFFRPFRTEPFVSTVRPPRPPQALVVQGPIRHLSRHNRRRIIELSQYIERVRLKIRRMSDRASWLERCSRPVEASVLRASARKEEEGLDDYIKEREAHREKLRNLKDVQRTLRESTTWRMVIPGQFDNPRRRGKDPQAWRQTCIDESEYEP